MAPALRIANFMDSALERLEQKGNLSHALDLYNPRGIAEKVVHFTPHAGDARFAALFDRHRVEIFPFFDSSNCGYVKRFVAALVALPRVILKIRAEHINVIRGRLPYFGSFIGCLAGRLLGIPSVVSLGGDNRLPQKREGRYYFGSRWLSFAIEKSVLMLCNSIIAPNEYTRDYVASIVGKRRAMSKVVIIPWIIDTQAHDVAELSPEQCMQLGIDSSLPVVLIVGHLNRYKYSTEMFEVAARVLDARTGRVQFVFCGDGPLRSDGELQLQRFSEVHFLGWQPNSIVLSLMHRATVVLVPMSGFVLLEAAALGKTVVASRIEWHGEIIADGDNGCLVRIDAVDEWCDRVFWLLDHPSEARLMGTKLQAVFEARYTAEISLKREADLYSRLIASAA